MIDDITLSKSKQIRGFNNTEPARPERREMDAAMKYIICALEIAFECPDAMAEKLKLQDDHIKNKASHPELRYKPSNHQLLNGREHDNKTDSGKYTDLRHPAFIKFMQRFDCLFIDGRK